MAQNKKNNYTSNHREGKPRTPSISAKIDRMVDGGGSTKAFASVTVAGAVAIHGLRVVEANNGVFVGMPTRSYTDNKGETHYSDIAHAVTKETYAAINEKVLEAYQQELSESKSEDQGETEDDDLPFDEDEADGFAQSM